MRKKRLSFFLLLVGLVFISSNAFAAWTQAKGHSYNQLTFSHYKTVEKFTTLASPLTDASGLDVPMHRIPSEEFTSTKISYYGEYGVTDKITAVISGGWDWQKTNDVQLHSNDDGPSGIGDIILGVSHKLSDNLGAGVLSSVQVDLKVPEAYDYRDPFLNQSLGDGQYDLTGKLLFGRGFGWGYTVLSAAYKYRFENDQLDGNKTFKPSDQILLGLSAGYNALPWLSIRGNLDYNRPVGNAEVSEALRVHHTFLGLGGDVYQDVALIKDTLSLEAEALSGGIALAFTVMPGTQVVVSYSTELWGEDASLGQTYSLAIAKSL